MRKHAAVAFWSRHGTVKQLGTVKRIIAAHFAFIALSMLCFGTMTLLSLLP